MNATALTVDATANAVSPSSEYEYAMPDSSAAMENIAYIRTEAEMRPTTYLPLG